jgi:hypothetical protein
VSVSDTVQHRSRLSEPVVANLKVQSVGLGSLSWLVGGPHQPYVDSP